MMQVVTSKGRLSLAGKLQEIDRDRRFLLRQA